MKLVLILAKDPRAGSDGRGLLSVLITKGWFPLPLSLDHKCV